MGKHGAGHLYQKNGSGCWRIRWMFEGKLHDESTGTTDYEKAQKRAKEKTACSQALGDVRALTARLERAKDEQTILEAKTNPSLNLFRMVAAFSSCDIVRRKKNSKRTLDAWQGYGNLLINHFGGNTEMRQLTREGVEAFMRDYESKVSATHKKVDPQLINPTNQGSGGRGNDGVTSGTRTHDIQNHNLTL